MKTTPGWLAGVLVAGVILLAGWLGFALTTATHAPETTDDPAVEASDWRDRDTRNAAREADPEVGLPNRRQLSISADSDTDRGFNTDRGRPEPARDRTAALRVQGIEIVDTDPELPSACIQLSSAPDPARSIEDKAFVRVEPDAPFSLQARGRSLCVLGLDADQSYTVRVLPGLTAQNGQTLEQSRSLDVVFAPKPAMVGFVGNGIILPRQGDSVLGLKAVNAGEVELTLFRVNHRALFQASPNIGSTVIEGQWGFNYEARQSRVEVHKETVDMSGDLNEQVERGFALGDLVEAQGPGAYVVELRHVVGSEQRRAARSWRWLYVTDIALASYRSEDALHVTARSIQTAKTLPGTRVALVARNNEVLAEATTDRSGRVEFPGAVLEGTGNLAPKMVLAYSGGEDFAALDLSRSPLDLSGYDVAGADRRGDTQAFLYTDRGVYRPGETVRLTALVRDRAGEAALDRPGTLVVAKPDGSALLEARVSPGGMAGALFRDVAIPDGSPRGRYTATLSLDGLDDPVGTLGFAVEDFVPEQLRVALRAATQPVVPGEPREITVASDFLYGAPGRDLNTEIEVRVQADPKPFADYAGFSFGNAVEPFREQFVPMDAGVTDDSGRFAATLDFARDQFPTTTPLRALVTAGVAEPGGRYIKDSALVPVRPGKVYVGFKPDFDNGYARRNTPASLSIVALDRAGERVDAEATLRLIEERYDYQWFRENGRWRYNRDRRDEAVSEQSVTIPAGKPFIFTRSLNYGQYRVEVEVDGAVSSFQFGSGWARAGGGTDAPDRFELGLDVASYQPGDTLALTLDAPFAGEAELVVADGGVQRIESLSLREGAQTVRVRTTGDATGDLYVMATLYAPLTEDAAPRRAVGLVHVPRERSAQIADVSVSAPDTIRPRTTQTVRVSTAEPLRGPAFVTLAAVDTGILNITDFSPPDPVAHLFGKRAFGVDVFDDYSRMLAPFNGTDRVGGDVLGGSGLSVVPTQTVALWHGPVELSGRTADIALDIPDFQGELTLMAVVWSDSRVGSASSTMVVRDPVTAQLAMPRFLAPGDTAVLTLALDNVDGQGGTYRSAVTRDGDTVGDAATELARGARGEERFTVSADTLGVATFALATRGPGFEVSRDYPIETRSPALPRTVTTRTRLAPGSRETLDVAALTESFVPGSVDTVVSASFSPMMDAGPLLGSLSRYPYGCTEQITSVAVPLLLSERIGTLPGQSAAQRRSALQAAVDKLLSRQDSTGAIGLWGQGDGHISPYLQLYASEFLLDAHAAGLDMPQSAVVRTLRAVRSLSELDGPARLDLDYGFGLARNNPDYEQRRAERAAYAHAVLARHDTVKKTEIVYLHDRFHERMEDSVALSQLGAALFAIGDTERAAQSFVRAVEVMGGQSPRNYYNTLIRNAAAVLALGEDLSPDTLNAAVLALPEESDRRLNTHEKAWLLRAIARSGSPTEALPFEGQSAWTRAGRGSQRGVSGDGALSVENTHSRDVYLTVSVTGLPVELAPATSSGVDLAKTVFTMTGKVLQDATLPRGERAVILLETEARSSDSAMWVLADLLPAGLEIETVLSPEDAGDRGAFSWLGELDEMDLAEARDDRFVASWRTGADNRWDMESARRTAYVVRAVTEGDFVFPGAHVEDMYRAERNASTQGGRLVVSRGGEL